MTSTSTAYFVFKLPQANTNAAAFDDLVSDCDYQLTHDLIDDTEIIESADPYVLVAARLVCDQDEEGVEEIGAELDYTFGELDGPGSELVGCLLEYQPLDAIDAPTTTATGPTSPNSAWNSYSIRYTTIDKEGEHWRDRVLVIDSSSREQALDILLVTAHRPSGRCFQHHRQ